VDACADRLLVRADPSLFYIWVRNGSPGPLLSVCVGPLDCDLSIFSMRADTFGCEVVVCVGPLKIPLSRGPSEDNAES
jgi:hypothetical protein